MTASPSIGLRHLTPDEWVEGSCDSMWSDYNRTVELPPANRAETWIRKLYQASAYSAESNSFYRTWFSPAVSEEEWKALHEKFPSAGLQPSDFASFAFPRFIGSCCCLTTSPPPCHFKSVTNTKALT